MSYRSIALLAGVAAATLAGAPADAFWASFGGRASYGSYGSYGSTGSYGSYGSRGSYGSHGAALRVSYHASTGSYGSTGSHGSTGSTGSHGSYGSTGSYASTGSHGSHGVGPIRRLVAHIRAKHAASHGSYGSTGSHGSAGSHGSYGSHGSTGSHGSVGGYTPLSTGSHGSSGSHGGVIVHEHYSATSTAQPTIVAKPIEASGTLTVRVPADAIVFVNDHKTSSTGTVRNYVSHGLKQGESYKYNVRVEYTVAGKKVEATKDATVVGGAPSAELTFGESAGLAAAEPAETKLTLSVPADATVTLAGVTTSKVGTEREYTTTRLPAGETWDAYLVSVTAGGESQERTITLVGGESQHLVFDFGAEQVANKDEADKLAAR